MKRLLFSLVFFLFFASNAVGFQLDSPGATGGAAACNSITVDLWQAFEASNFLTSPPSNWSVTDTNSMLSKSSSAEKATISCFNGTADTGTSGIAITYQNNTNTGYISYTPASGSATASVGFWYKPGDWSGSSGSASNIFTSYSSVFSINVKYENNSGTREFHLQLDGGSDQTATGSYSDGTWYWVTVKNNDSPSTVTLDICTGNPCNSSNLVGTASQAGQYWSAYTSFRLGTTYVAGSPTATDYFDDFVYLASGSTFPLGP